MKKLISLTLPIFLAACVNPQLHELDHYQSRFKQYGYGFIPEEGNFEHANRNRVDPQIMKMYADKIVRNLKNDVDELSLQDVVVASYVDLDETLGATNALGNQLAEYVTISLKQHNFKVSDLYVNDSIQLTKEGAFVLQRSGKDVLLNNYIVTGTIIYGPDNANINTRLVDVSDKKVIAANTISMPNFIVKQAFPVVEGQDLLIKGK